jgi:hypothetical protein
LVFDKSFTFTLVLKADAHTGQTQTHHLLIKKNGTTIYTGPAVTGYTSSTLIFTINEVISVDANDTIGIYIDRSNYSFSMWRHWYFALL